LVDIRIGLVGLRKERLVLEKKRYSNKDSGISRYEKVMEGMRSVVKNEHSRLG
jgi:hypothetical protein